MSFRHLLLMSVAIVGCSSPEDTKLINESVSSFKRMAPDAKVSDHNPGKITADAYEVTFFSDGFEYSFDTQRKKSIAENSMPFIAFQPTNRSVCLQQYLECTIEDKESKCELFSCQSTSKDGRRTIRLTMHQGD